MPTATPTSTSKRPTRAPAKTWQGTIMRLPTPTSAVVEVSSVKQHAKYRKRYAWTTRYVVHVRKGQAVSVGQHVLIAPTRPRSGNKRWRLA